MTLEEALKIGNGKATSLWRAVTLDELISHLPGHTIGRIIVVKKDDRHYTIAAAKYEDIAAAKHGERKLSYIACVVPGYDELCMEVTGPPYMALTQDGWKPITR
jgi:hypothetical protein